MSIDNWLGVILEMIGILRMAISYSSYVKQLCKYVLSSSLVLGLILGISVFVAGEGSINADLDFDFEGLDGLWLILGLPLVSVVVVALLSPLSFFLHKLLSKRDSENVAPDA